MVRERHHVTCLRSCAFSELCVYGSVCWFMVVLLLLMLLRFQVGIFKLFPFLRLPVDQRREGLLQYTRY